LRLLFSSLVSFTGLPFSETQGRSDNDDGDLFENTQHWIRNPAPRLCKLVGGLRSVWLGLCFPGAVVVVRLNGVP
jgi:hypothetical protein